MILYSRTLSITDLYAIANDLGIRLECDADFFGPRSRRLNLRLFAEVGSDQFRKINVARYLKSGRRRTGAVCWHGHYAFMRAVFMLDANAKFRTAIDTWDGRQDFFKRAAESGRKNVGSIMEPLAYANACDCWAGQSEIVRRTVEQVSDDHDTVQFGTLETDGNVTNVRVLRSSDLRACPHFILVPEHYRDDGSCRCNDPEATVMKEWGYVWVDGMWRGELEQEA